MKQELFSGAGVVLRLGELYLKGGNRRLFMNALVANAKRALQGRDEVRMHVSEGRVFLTGADDEDICARMRWVFGFSSYSPVRYCEKSIDAICAQAVSLARAYGGSPQTTFRIAARRSDKSFDHTSAQIGILAGNAVNEATGFGVDLESPDLSIGVEVGKEWCFLWTQQLEGARGLPVGTSGRVMLLLSGGIDSPVAGHLLQKRGVELSGVYFHAFPYTSDGAKQKVIDLARVLARRQRSFRLHVVHFAATQEALRDAAGQGYLVLLYRRMMMRIAGELARGQKMAALATGENLGQVASQTLENMAVVEAAAPFPVLRPLLTADKLETISLARTIGTFDISVRPFEDCCTLFVPPHPQTRGRADIAQKMESRVDIEACVADAVRTVEVIDL